MAEKYLTETGLKKAFELLKTVTDGLDTAKADKATTLAGYSIGDAYTKTEIDAKIASVFHYKGTVASYADLPTSDLSVGDVYNLADTGANYAWTGSEWDKLSETVDLSPYLTIETAAATYETLTNAAATKKALEASIATKQDNLTTAQLAAVNSGITSTKVSTYDGYADTLADLEDTKADKSELPTVNDATITFTQGTETLGTFTTNDADAVTIDIAPITTSEVATIYSSVFTS